MHKRAVLGNLVLLLATGIFFAFGVLSCFAEDITITTYYPSPYGSYNELQTKKFAVGDTNDSGGLDSGDQPPENGQIYTARSIIYKPQASLAVIQNLSNPQIGELAYAAAEDKWYYYNDAWVEQGGGGGCYVSYSSGANPCLAGFTDEGSAGNWGQCIRGGVDDTASFLPPGGSCGGSGWAARNLGDARVCCK